jgi:WD40 repeat protein
MHSSKLLLTLLILTLRHVVMVLCSSREWPARDLISTEEHQDYIYIHQDHTDWVSQVEWVPEVGLVSSSIDSTIKIYDFVREKVVNTCTQHSKAVHGFVWCSAYTLFASCGVERDIFLWQGNTGRRVGELTGHTASVTHLALDEKLNHVFSMSSDKMIKVWDLRNHKCLQTIAPEDWTKREESKPYCLMYDSIHRRIVTAMNKPYVWVHKLVTQDRTGHMHPVRSVLYNLTFDVIVSADEGGTVCVWNIATGAREGRFMKAHGDAKLTAMCFDKNERRLVTAGGDGSVFMWNFNNGSKLREYAHAEEQQELVSVIFLADEKRESDAVYAAGWNAKIFVWEEDDDVDVVTEYRSYEGHREDITSMAAYSKRMVLATGDYEGRITIWNPFTGEKRMCLFHRAERYETTVECMLWVPLRSVRKKAVRSLLSSLGRSNLSMASSAVAEGITSHAGIVMNSDDPALNESSLLSNAHPMLLLSSGGDGLIRVWLVGSVGKLVCSLQGAQGRLEQVSCMAADRSLSWETRQDTSVSGISQMGSKLEAWRLVAVRSMRSVTGELTRPPSMLSTLFLTGIWSLWPARTTM